MPRRLPIQTANAAVEKSAVKSTQKPAKLPNIWDVKRPFKRFWLSLATLFMSICQAWHMLNGYGVFGCLLMLMMATHGSYSLLMVLFKPVF